MSEHIKKFTAAELILLQNIVMMQIGSVKKQIENEPSVELRKLYYKHLCDSRGLLEILSNEEL